MGTLSNQLMVVKNNLQSSLDEINKKYEAVGLDKESNVTSVVLPEYIERIPVNMDYTPDINKILYEEFATYDIPEGYHKSINIKIQTQEKTALPGKTLQIIEPDDEHVLSRVFIEGDEDLISENIKTGVTIFGVTGTLDEIKNYNIIYIVNEYGVVAEKQTILYDSTFNISSNVPSSSPTKIFKGWSTSPNAVTPIYQPNDTISTNLADKGDVAILYAVWKNNTSPGAPLMNFVYNNGACINSSTNTETATINITHGIDPEGDPVTTELKCLSPGVTLTKVNDTEYTAVFPNPGVYVFVAITKDEAGLCSKAASQTAMIMQSDGSFGGNGDFTTDGSSGIYNSAITDFIPGCYITKVKFSVTVNNSHGADTDQMTVNEYHSSGSMTSSQLFLGDFSGFTLNEKTKTYTKADDVRRVQFNASSPHPDCVSASSTILWDVEYEFDMDLYMSDTGTTI